MNILFICSANKDRSRTAEDYFASRYPNSTFQSAGTNRKICRQLGTQYLEEQQLIWANRIYVMETKHYNTIKEIFGNMYHSKITVLHIKDRYPYGDTKLKEILKRKVSIV